MSILKVIFRVFLILAAALLVVGATLAVSHTSLGAQILSVRGGLEDGFHNAATNASQFSANFATRAGGGGDFERAGGGSLFSGLAHNLATLGAIVLVYIAISLSYSRLKGRFKKKHSSLRSAAL